MLHVLDRTYAWPLWLGLALAAACVGSAVAARRRGRPVPPFLALLLCGLPLGAAAVAVRWAFVAVRPPPPGLKLHPATLALAECADAIALAGTATLVAALLTAALAPDLRRAALAAIPATAAVLAWSAWNVGRIRAMVLLPPDEKAPAWFADEPTHAALALAIVATGALSAVAADRRVATATALAPVLPMLAWPGFLVGFRFTEA